MSYMDGSITDGGVIDLSIDEIENVSGGIIPLLLAAAATYIEFSFVIGVFDGASASARS
jgi:lactobin A/cerein 7B family class IIb bacteriocin